MCKWRIDILEGKEKQQEFQEEMVRHAAKFSELLESVDTTNAEMERDRAGTMITEGWEPLVKTAASTTVGKKLSICNRAEKCREE